MVSLLDCGSAARSAGSGKDLSDEGLLALVGLLLIAAGLAALIHPRLKMPARKTEVEVIGQKLEIETQRIVTIPGIVSGLVIVAGAGLILLDTRKR